MQNFLYYLKCIILFPMWREGNNHKNSTLLRLDIARWQTIKHLGNSNYETFNILMINYPEFRNIYYYRTNSKFRKLQKLLFPPVSTLFIWSPEIGPGLFIQHGFATVIAAKSIGKNCFINQQVTIGYTSDNDCPVIFDDVTITAGAKVLGNITVGNNVMVGANAVVVKNVPDNCTVVGVPAYIIKEDGIKVKKML